MDQTVCSEHRHTVDHLFSDVDGGKLGSGHSQTDRRV